MEGRKEGRDLSRLDRRAHLCIGNCVISVYVRGASTQNLRANNIARREMAGNSLVWRRMVTLCIAKKIAFPNSHIVSYDGRITVSL